MRGIPWAVSLVFSSKAWAGSACLALQERQNGLLQRAHEAEVQLVQAERRQLCPQLERLAEQLQAGLLLPDREPPLDYGAYNQCRRRAEQRLADTRPVLYRNAQGLPYYTQAGAGWARLALDHEARVQEPCRSLSVGRASPAGPP